MCLIPGYTGESEAACGGLDAPVVAVSTMFQFFDDLKKEVLLLSGKKMIVNARMRPCGAYRSSPLCIASGRPGSSNCALFE
jgi:hypothetical protein